MRFSVLPALLLPIISVSAQEAPSEQMSQALQPAVTTPPTILQPTTAPQPSQGVEVVNDDEDTNKLE